MKTPDEIKKGLECCARVGYCYKCPYQEGCFHPSDDVCPMHMDALAYIQQLEADNAQQARCIENLTDKLNATNDAPPCWISVKERLPEHEEYVLVCIRGIIYTGYYDARGRYWEVEGSRENEKLTHWMPLPEPPQEE